VTLLVMLSQSPVLADESLGARAERILKELSALTELKPVVEPLVARSQQALERAKNARRAGDQHHGSELEALGLELAESARDLARVQRTERDVGEVERKAVEAETRLVRARALLEQAAARRGRAAERLQQAEADKKQTPTSAADKTRPVIPGATDKKTAPRPKPATASSPSPTSPTPSTPLPPASTKSKGSSGATP
jgi:hypothetical protein